MLGTDDTTGQPVLLKHGRFGHYVQLGENGGGEKPKMASLWPSMSPESLTLEDALMLLSFPREIGLHPESGKPILAAAGRYGPYISCDGDNRTLPDYDSLATITVDGAVELLKQPKSRGRRAGGSSVLAELGPHPSSGATITVRTGRYGPYVSDGTVHATVPKKTDPAAVTLETAVELLAAREDKLKSQGKDPRAPKRRKPSPSPTRPRRVAYPSRFRFRARCPNSNPIATVTEARSAVPGSCEPSASHAVEGGAGSSVVTERALP